jgi:hypothetical protein
MSDNKFSHIKLIFVSKKQFMESLKYLYLGGFAAFLFWSCAPASTTKSSDKGRNYHEDLSVHRPDFEVKGSENLSESTYEKPKQNVIPKNDVTAKINAIMDSVAVKNKENKYFNGYTIQIYAGNSREAAVQAKESVYRLLPNSSPKISYIQPNYRVKIGQFIERIEAQRYYLDIKQGFPNAIIIPERIEIE